MDIPQYCLYKCYRISGITVAIHRTIQKQIRSQVLFLFAIFDYLLHEIKTDLKGFICRSIKKPTCYFYFFFFFWLTSGLSVFPVDIKSKKKTLKNKLNKRQSKHTAYSDQYKNSLTKWSKTKRKRIELASQEKRRSECYLSVVKKK